MDTTTNDLIINNINTSIISVNNDTTDDLIINNILNNNKIDTLTTVDIDSNLKDNLLYKIKSNKKHPFNEFIEINDDYKSIKSKYRPNDIVVYGNGKTMLESLGRELFIHFDKRIKINNGFFEVEHTLPSGKQSDIVCKDKSNKTFYILEFKIYDKKENIKVTIENAQKQLLTYATEYAEISKQTNNIICSVVVIDIEELISNPYKIDLFNNNISKTKVDESSIHNIGICIKNVHFDVNKKDFINSTNLVSTEIPIFEKFENNGNTITRNCIDAYKTITSTNAYGLNNVRERLPLTINQKLYLFLDMFDTLIDFGLKNKNHNVFLTHSDQKSFLYVKDSSVKIEDSNDLIIVSTNAALINGQQSTHIPYEIEQSLIRIKNNVNLENHDIKLKNKLKNKGIINSKSIINDNKAIDEIIDFLKLCNFNYIVSQVENSYEGMAIAHSKNSSININTEDLQMYEESGLKYKFLSQLITENNKVVYPYNNISCKFSDIAHSKTSIRKIPLLYSLFNNERNLIESNIKTYSRLAKNPLKPSKKDFEGNINLLIEKINIDDINNLNQIKPLDAECKILKKEKQVIENNIFKLETEIKEITRKYNNENDDVLKYDIEIELKQQQRNKLIETKKMEEIESNIISIEHELELLYLKFEKELKIKDDKILNNMCNMLQNYEKSLIELESIIDEYPSMTKNIDKDKISLLSLIIIMISKNNKVLLRNFTNNEISQIKECFFNLNKIKTEYNFGWIADIGNNKSENDFNNLKIKSNLSNNEITLKELINNIFNYQNKIILNDNIVDTNIINIDEDEDEDDINNTISDFLNA